MGGQCPGAPELKGPLKERDKKKKKRKMKNIKEKKKEKGEKRDRNFSNIRPGAPSRYIPMSLSR